MKKWLIIAFSLCLLCFTTSCGSNVFSNKTNISTVTIMTTDKDDKPTTIAINLTDNFISYPKGVKREISQDDANKLFSIMEQLGFLSMPNKPASYRYEVSIITKEGQTKTFGTKDMEYPDYLIDFIRKASEALGYNFLTNKEEYSPLSWSITLEDTNSVKFYSVTEIASSDPNFSTYYPKAKMGLYIKTNEENLFEYALNNKASLQKDRTNMYCKMGIEISLLYAKIKEVRVEEYDSSFNKTESYEYGLKYNNLVDAFSYDKTIPLSKFVISSFYYGSIRVNIDHYYIFTVEDNSGNYYITAIYVS